LVAVISETEIVALRVVQALEKLNIEYEIGGSVASILYGIPRLTADVDIVVLLQGEHVGPLVQEMESEFYIDADTVREAIVNRSSFNIIHLPTMIKADLFVRPDTAFARSEWARRASRPLSTATSDTPVFVASAEDTVLHKLRWYKLTGERSDRQWSDVLGVLKTQKQAIDQAYMKHWAEELNLDNLLAQALQEADITT
jgi:hypothetical protein